MANIHAHSEIAAAAGAFVRQSLVPMWNEVTQRIRATAGREGLAERIPVSDERLSPCDFGFHNAINGSAGAIRFIDFEYAGWDDPARVVCDFFCQPAVPVPRRFFDLVASRLTEDLSDPQWHRCRIRLLLPVYQIRWCCILLNDFLDVAGHRRQFAGSADDPDARKRAQLDKAIAAFGNVGLELS